MSLKKFKWFANPSRIRMMWIGCPYEHIHCSVEELVMVTKRLVVCRRVARGGESRAMPPPNPERCTKNFQGNQGFDA